MLAPMQRAGHGRMPVTCLRMFKDLSLYPRIHKRKKKKEMAMSVIPVLRKKRQMVLWGLTGQKAWLSLGASGSVRDAVSKH